jgi:hypothetical protein
MTLTYIKGISGKNKFGTDACVRYDAYVRCVRAKMADVVWRKSIFTFLALRWILIVSYIFYFREDNESGK